MVEFETTAVDQEADALAAAAGRIFHGAPELAFKRAEYALIKEAAVDAIAGVEVLQEYRNLPVGFLRIASESALFALLALPEVSAVREVEQYELFTAETLPFIEQPPVDAAGIRGQGMTVAVLDTGVLWQQAVFQCPMPPGTPGCRIVDAIFEAAPDDGNDQDDHPSFHGTNVSGIVAETAPDTTLLVADVADPGSFQFPFAIRDPSVYSAVDWVLDRVGTFNIASMNLSFGKAIPYHTQPCASAALGPALDSVLAAGIQPVAAAGNGAFQNGSFVDGIIEPACSPAAVSVGAVYDLNYGSVTWPFGVNQCTDPATQEDLVTCFSQTAPFLSLLAPGVAVEAAGIVLTGTSMAAPHVAGAWAIYRAAMPGASHAEILQALQDRGQPDSDPRVANRVVSRINLFDGLDADQGVGDGVLFPQDNCTELINASQVDSDTDGFGNHCDGDFDQDGGAGIPDFAIFRACVGEAVPSASMAGGDHDPTCAESDMTGDGGVGILDFAYFRAALGDPPGPSGLPCADPVEPMPGCTTPASLAGNAAQLTGDGAGEAAGLYEEEDAQGRFVFAADSSGAELTVHTDASGEATHVTDETGATVLDLAP